MLSRTMADREGGEDNPQPGQPSTCGVILRRVVRNGGRAEGAVGTRAARCAGCQGPPPRWQATFSPGNLIKFFSIYAPRFLPWSTRLKIHGISRPVVELRKVVRPRMN